MPGRSSCPKDDALRPAHAEKEREISPTQNNRDAKPEQLKLSKTDPSIWPSIARLLICKA
jgi:hypothetical protein